MISVTPSLVLCAFVASLEIVTSTMTGSFQNSQNARRTMLDPVNNFFSELGNLILDVDRTYSQQSRPLVNFENRLEQQIFHGKREPRHDHFDRIRQNYRELQKRIGSSLDFLNSPNNVFGINVPTQNPDSKSSTTESDVHSTNSLANSNEDENTEIPIDVSSESTAGFSKRSGTRKPMYIEDDGETSKQNSPNEEATREYPTTANSDDTENHATETPAMDSQPDGRILGDVLYSESSFDNYMKRLLEQHSKWLLDPKILATKQGLKTQSSSLPNAAKKMVDRIFPSSVPVKRLSADQKVELTTEAYVPLSADSRQKLKEGVTRRHGSLSGSEDPITDMSEFYYDKSNDETSNESLETSESYSREISTLRDSAYTKEAWTRPPLGDDLYFGDEVGYDGDQEGGGSEVYDFPEDAYAMESYVEEELKDQVGEETRDSVILAFTPDGVPLKLHFSSQVENPIKFLHKALRAAGVSLNIPVESYGDIEPVGKEILQLGSGSGGVITRALYVDLSNRYELQSLLRSLRKSKAAQKWYLES